MGVNVPNPDPIKETVSFLTFQFSKGAYNRLEAYKAALTSPGLSTLVFEDEKEFLAVVRRTADEALKYAEESASAENESTQPA